MFLVNSRLGLLAAAPSRSTRQGLHAAGAPLLPKLRGEFAEFLNGGSPVHLGMLYLPTCVGLRYGRPRISLAAFLGSPASTRPAWGRPRAFHSPLGHRHRGFACGGSLPAWRDRSPGPSPLRPRITLGAEAPSMEGGTGLFARCPSPAPRGLGLGPPHPQLISMAAEPLGIRWGGFAPPSRYSCRHSHSPPLHGRFRSRFAGDGDAPLPRAARAVTPASDTHPRRRCRA